MRAATFGCVALSVVSRRLKSLAARVPKLAFAAADFFVERGEGGKERAPAAAVPGLPLKGAYKTIDRSVVQIVIAPPRPNFRSVKVFKMPIFREKILSMVRKHECFNHRFTSQLSRDS